MILWLLLIFLSLINDKNISFGAGVAGFWTRHWPEITMFTVFLLSFLRKKGPITVNLEQNSYCCSAPLGSYHLLCRKTFCENCNYVVQQLRPIDLCLLLVSE